MNKETPYNINYTFYVQSAEDFYAQLREFERQHYLTELEVDTENLELAQNMLASIGIQCK